MANSKYSYVKKFEKNDEILPQTYILIRIDGKGFHKFTEIHKFTKPNDTQGIMLMNYCAQEVMKMFPDIFMAYGQSDEYSFALRRDTQLYKRRGDKLVSIIVSCFTSNYAINFQDFMSQKLIEIPLFDGRYIVYPNYQSLQDYFKWRQVDCHINNLYNTCFWLMVQKDGLSNFEAQSILKDTNASQKNEIMFQKFGVNYNNEPFMFKKGSILIRIKDQIEGKNKEKWTTIVLHEDLIQDIFWNHYKISLCF